MAARSQRESLQRRGSERKREGEEGRPMDDANRDGVTRSGQTASKREVGVDRSEAGCQAVPISSEGCQ